MAAKISAFLITFLLNVAVGVVILFFMLIAMNGFNESDAMWGLGAFVILALLTSIAISTGSLLFVGFLTKRQRTPLVSALIAIPVFSIVGIVIEIVCSLIGVGVAELMRVNKG